MKSHTELMFNTLFKPEDWAYFTSNFREGLNSSISDLDFRRFKYKYFCINPLHPHSTRSSKNISAYRNFMIEFDNMKRSTQLDLLMNSGIPFTTLVDSGNKSIHATISLETPVSHEEWVEIMQRLHLKFPAADSACKASCQLSRVPVKRDQLILLGKTISVDDLTLRLPKLNKVETLKYGKSRDELTAAASRYLRGETQTGKRHSASLHTIKTLLEMQMDRARIVELVTAARMIYDPTIPVAQNTNEVQRRVDWVARQWS